MVFCNRKTSEATHLCVTEQVKCITKTVSALKLPLFVSSLLLVATCWSWQLNAIRQKGNIRENLRPRKSPSQHFRLTNVISKAEITKTGRWGSSKAQGQGSSTTGVKIVLVGIMYFPNNSHQSQQYLRKHSPGCMKWKQPRGKWKVHWGVVK